MALFHFLVLWIAYTTLAYAKGTHSGSPVWALVPAALAWGMIWAVLFSVALLALGALLALHIPSIVAWIVTGTVLETVLTLVRAKKLEVVK